MNSTSPYDLDSSTGITPMSESLVGNTTNPPLITTNDIDLATEDKHLLLNQDNSSSSPNPIDNIPLESPSSSNIITKKQKSLISVYDNSNDGEQQHQQASNPNSLPLVGILGRNQRSEAFRKRLLLSAFPKPILCDTKSPEFDFNNQSNYVSSDIFLRQSPSIILITENFSHNSEHFFNLNKQQLIIDVRELNFSKNSSHSPLPIPECYQAFGNLSNWEIENGTQRVAVAVEQSSPLNLIKFIHQLNCFSRGITSVDQYTYNNERIKSFRHCLFPLISTIVIFSICFIFSLIEYRVDHHTHSRIDYLYHQASSITAVTSLTLLSLLFLIRPLLESMEYFSKILNQQTQRWLFLSRWLQSRRYLAWYSLAFACLHVLFYLISKNDYNEKLFFLPAFFGVITLVVLTILSFVYFPWISERLLWREYHLLASYFGPFGLLIAFLHVFIHWKYDYYYHTGEKQLFTLKFLSMFLPFLVLVLRILIYGIIRPVNKLLRIRQKRSKTSIETKKDTTLLP